MPAQARSGVGRRGPYLAVATICERVLTETDSVQSAIRMVDNVTISPAVANPPPGAVAPAPVFTADLIVIFKSGDAPGLYRLDVVAEAPSGRKSALEPHTLELPSLPHGGASVVYRLNLVLTETGLYRFAVRLDGRFLTAIPLQVRFASGVPPIAPIDAAARGSQRRPSKRAPGKTRAVRPRSRTRR